jgi:hypothetical protein
MLDMMYTSSDNNHQTNTINPSSQGYYFNCFVVNIDGPINFNATHSLQDDGSDLLMNDINTIRFFYNLGIEYYRLNIATSYNQLHQNYSTGCYQTLTPVNTALNSTNSSTITSSVNSNTTSNSVANQATSSSSNNNIKHNNNNNTIHLQSTVINGSSATETVTTASTTAVQDQQVIDTASSNSILTSTQQHQNQQKQTQHPQQQVVPNSSHMKSKAFSGSK